MGTALAGGDPSAGPVVTGSFGGPGGAGRPGGLPDGGGPGGFGGGAADTAVVDYLVANRGDATWLVAVSGSGSAAPIQLASGLPVLAMGGFNGGDDAPTLEAFTAYVTSGELRFVLVGGNGPGGGGFGGSGGSSQVSSWVGANCAAVDAGAGNGAALYDCAAAAG